jgi:6-pyruvoyltetrahydropterin/6-carboxytetrahydropterin synthase
MAEVKLYTVVDAAGKVIAGGLTDVEAQIVAARDAGRRVVPDAAAAARVTIRKTVRFSAAHRLSGLPDEHPCSRVHGHNWEVDVQVTGPPGPAGMVIDFGVLALAVVGELDHQWLGDGPLWDSRPGYPALSKIEPVLDFNPTAENLACWLHTRISKLGEGWIVRVAVKETPTSEAVYPSE